jgi:hypothetical protein
MPCPPELRIHFPRLLLLLARLLLLLLPLLLLLLLLLVRVRLLLLLLLLLLLRVLLLLTLQGLLPRRRHDDAVHGRLVGETCTYLPKRGPCSVRAHRSRQAVH